MAGMKYQGYYMISQTIKLDGQKIENKGKGNC